MADMSQTFANKVSPYAAYREVRCYMAYVTPYIYIIIWQKN